MVRERTRSSSWLLTKAAKAAHALGGFWGLSIKMSSRFVAMTHCVSLSM